MKKLEPLNYEQGFNYAMRLLNQRGYSITKLTQKLKSRVEPPEDIKKIIARLVELDFLNDDRYAASVARSQATYRHSSQRKISYKLMQKGIAKSVAENALSDEELPTELERAKLLAEKWLVNKHSPLSFELKQKLAAYLFRQGFSGGVISNVIKVIASE